MSKTLIGICTFGNLPFSKLAVESVRNTTTKSFDFFLVVGKPGDTATIEWLEQEGIKHIVHDKNWGFPCALNDIYDYAWIENDYDYLVIMGNDVIVYPRAIDSLIEVADTHDYDWICASQYEIRQLLEEFPEYQKYFDSACRVTDFSHRCWERFENWDRPITVVGPGMSDVHNLALYKKAVFEKVGYIDVGYYPAYFCLTPETPILTDDLKWKSLEDIKIGDGIVGVDEYPEAPRASRSYRQAIVENKRKLKADCLKITLADGRSVICSKNHKWLVKRPTAEGYFWREAEKLYAGMRMCISLIAKKSWDGVRIRSKYTKNYLSIIDIENVGIKDVIDIQVSTRAFVANGIVSHNSDNDYCRRSANLGVTSCTLLNAMYFHFWSRTIFQEDGGSNHEFFRANSTFYRMKWGGPFGKEAFTEPFNGYDFILCPGVVLKSETKISSRHQEKDIITYWMNR